MIQFLISAPRSGSGKTTVTCALLAKLKKYGYAPAAFKCGSDYIDPMFHRSVLGVDSHNLDLFFSDAETVRRLYAMGTRKHDAVICEGAMGFYDGLGGTSDAASAWRVADTLDLPVLLVLPSKGASLTLAAEVNGLKSFRTSSHISGILLNDCSPSLYKMLASMLERETKLPVLGYLPHVSEGTFESRHLGLKTAGEIVGLQQKVEDLAEALVLDRSRFEEVFDCPAPSVPVLLTKKPTVRIAVAQDEAFCFTYAETLEALESAGAELVRFSPLKDAALPENIDGLYLPGGYPELYTKALSENQPMLNSVRTAIENGLPTVAECGGFLYLGKSLEDADGQSFPMVVTLSGEGFKVGRLVRFGYAKLTARADSMLFRAGETLPVHEFHYWDSTENGTDLLAAKANGIQWNCGFANAHFYAGFPHLYWAGTPLPERFVAAARQYQKQGR